LYNAFKLVEDHFRKLWLKVGNINGIEKKKNERF
jgi:hypothetical protein